MLALAVAAATLFVNRLDGLVANMIESQGSEVLGTEVSVDGVSTNLQSGTAIITGLTLKNPEGYSDELALELPKVVAEVDYSSRIIRSIVIENPIVNAELKGSENNFQTLLNNMPSDSARGDNSSAESEIVLTIQRLMIAQSTINLKITEPEIGQRSFVMDDYVMTDLSGTVDELSDQILTGLTRHISGQVSRYAQKELTKRALEEVKGEVTEKLGDALKDLGL